ncbi:hypothetical protein [Streptomyces sp. NPDC004134]|uniref:hypothetical protein n=1 Tax=Streptomyces sp. NPDC004134 TaxID=3364691 RepID=UPI00367D1445
MNRFLPAVDRPWLDSWPAVARGGDGNAWVPGVCWLFCRREGVAVLWVGSVITPGAGGEMYACGSCIAELDHMVRVQAQTRDRQGHRTARYATLTLPAHHSAVTRTDGCEHPRTEQHAGKTYCQHCKRQLYL